MLRTDLLKTPITVASIELLRNGSTLLVRARSRDGAESVTVPNVAHLIDVYPLLLARVAPFFVGKDARDLESLLWELYRQDSNYKLQGLSFWVCVAAVEMALLDLIGQTSKHSVGELLSKDGVRRRDIAVYRASGKRGNRPEEEIDYLHKLQAETGSKAIKFRLGGRMSLNADSLPGRTDTLIPLVRKTFGDAMTLYARRQQLVRRAERAAHRPPAGGARLRAVRGALPLRRPLGDQGDRRRDEDPGRARRAGVEPAAVPVADREPRDGRRAARPALLRRLHPLHQGRAHGGGRGAARARCTCRSRGSAT